MVNAPPADAEGPTIPWGFFYASLQGGFMKLKFKLAFCTFAALGLSALSVNALAACPVGKQGGGTWCANGWEWKCEKCGSEYCSIMTGRKCLKDDADAKDAGPLAMLSFEWNGIPLRGQVESLIKRQGRLGGMSTAFAWTCVGARVARIEQVCCCGVALQMCIVASH